MKKYTLAVLLITLLSLLPLGAKVSAEDDVPMISILGVTEDDKVTIETENFPANRDFIAWMGQFGTQGVDGIEVGTVNSGKGGNLKFTFSIPLSLQNEGKIAIRLESINGSYYAYNWFSNTTFGTHTGGTPAEEVPAQPEIMPASVKEDTLVIIKGLNFPANETFDVIMGEEGSKGIGGIQVDILDLEDETTFIHTFNIPSSLQGETKLDIRFESNESDLAVYTTFENQTGASGGTTEDFNDGGTSDIPTIAILSIKEDESVTLKTYNFPAGRDIQVLMGEMGTRGIGGIQVTTFSSETGSSLTKTFDIPDALNGEYQIAIRLQTADGVFFAYNWFFNDTAANGGNGTTTPGYTGIPTFAITAVEKGATVTINTHNFPANIDFKVLMGKMGTKGVGGTTVTQINSGSGGVFTKTFDIPASLAGEERIAIRLEALSGGYFAYNWFLNATYP
jgi:hypothetical protein